MIGVRPSLYIQISQFSLASSSPKWEKKKGKRLWRERNDVTTIGTSLFPAVSPTCIIHRGKQELDWIQTRPLNLPFNTHTSIATLRKRNEKKTNQVGSQLSYLVKVNKLSSKGYSSCVLGHMTWMFSAIWIIDFAAFIHFLRCHIFNLFSNGFIFGQMCTVTNLASLPTVWWYDIERGCSSDVTSWRPYYMRLLTFS